VDNRGTLMPRIYGQDLGARSGDRGLQSRDRACSGKEHTKTGQGKDGPHGTEFVFEDAEIRWCRPMCRWSISASADPRTWQDLAGGRT